MANVGRRVGLGDKAPPPGLSYSRARTPTFDSLEPLRAYLDADVADAIIKPEPGITAFEQPENKHLLHSNGLITGLDDDIDTWERAFDELILPTSVAVVTRAGYFAQWRSVVTFAFTMGLLGEVLPMSERLLKAFLLQAILVGYRVGTITSYVSAI